MYVYAGILIAYPNAIALDKINFPLTQDFLSPAVRQCAVRWVGVRFVGQKKTKGTAYPKVNVYEYEDRIGIIAEIPGLKKKQLNIEVEDGVLTISGDKHGILDDKGATVLRRELKASSFKRSFELGDLLDTDSINASFDDGILSISIDKIEP